ncbi:MAG TPA: HK97 family phage prohead protease [Actinomycetota bacterium]|nr:HK97 family phage prohead protease [Actinomycetota bacterium]
MPWHIEPNSSSCPAGKPFAVVLDATGKAVGCHPTKAKAAAQLAALNANVKGVEMGKKTQSFVEEAPSTTTSAAPTAVERVGDEATDEERWDGDAAMRKCSTAGDFRSIAFELSNDSDPATAAHWALPHHAAPHGPADPGGVSAALGRLGQTGSTVLSKDSIRSHLTRHQGGAKSTFPKESLYRAIWPTDLELRSEDGFPGPVMFGHFAVFDEWTRIDSLFEGEFMERLVRGAFEKTFAENRSSIRPLFQHGRDSYIGSKVLGPVEILREEERGAYYEVPLLDTAYNRELEPGLRAGLYGASFRFRVMREEIVEKPKRSDYNPDGLPERSIKEVELHEFGPVTFPAYDGATAGIRSLTDEFVLQPYTRDRQRLRELLRYLEGEPAEGDADEAPEPVTSPDRDAARGSVPGTSRKVRDYLDPKEAGPSWIL